MSEEFRRKLKQYADGTLPESEREEVEREMDKMEAYQTYLEDAMGGDRKQAAALPESQRAGYPAEPETPIDEKRILRKGKWRARIVTTWNVLALLIIVMIVGSVLTSLYYDSGNPERRTMYRDIVVSTVAVSRPNVSLNVNSQSNMLTLNLSGKMNKQVGDKDYAVGDFSMKFLLGGASVPQETRLEEGNTGFYTFRHPGYNLSADAHEGVERRKEEQDQTGWKTLEKLPEGTVAEAYLSFDRLFATDELLARFEPANLLPVWFAVNTGPESYRSYGGAVAFPVGFPYRPMWHPDDLKIEHYEEKRSGLFGKIVSSGGSYPSVAAYGSGALRNENFLKTLRLLQEYRSIARKTAPFTDIDAAVGYVEENGVQLYGAVVTGPVKELLKLREESWIRDFHVGEVRLWNWRDR
ncbi:anti-sigma factor [Paenibacillus hodogayensis]|uniref:Anti-sigma factor n=1 Tax=Paenibacillus hodogayensis TaxID=279208 RepID=A0ABV5W3L0_9BACL